MQFQRILIAINGNAAAAKAAAAGLDLAEALGAQVALVHVAEVSVPVGGTMGISEAELQSIVEQEASKAFDNIKRVRPMSEHALQFVRSAHEPWKPIVEIAAEWRADVLVVGSHGRQGLPRFLLGSVADNIACNARCPVLIVRSSD